jgi:hypothetical protein
MIPTKAVYVDWHLPKKKRGAGLPFKKPWEIAMIVRSTHFSRVYNDLSPVLYCDEDTFEYYDELGLLKHFDDVHMILPNEVDYDANIFWSAGKFYAIQHCEENFVMLDLDAEIRFKFDFEDFDVYCAHLESVERTDLKYYPDAQYLDTKDHLGKKYNVNWGDSACNTSVLYIKDLDFAKKYANAAIDFITNVDDINPAFEKNSYMLLVEQRLLCELINADALKLGCMISGKHIPNNTSRGLPAFEDSNLEEVLDMGFLSVCGFKNDMLGNKEREEEFFGDLISSFHEISSDIIYSVSMNYKLYIDK